MMLALRELRRRPGRFAIATVTLTLIAVLLMFLGGLLDGLIDSSVAAVKAQDADIIVYSSRAGGSFERSRVSIALRRLVTQVPGAAEIGGIGVVQLGARLPNAGPRDLIDVALFGYELPPRGVPAPPADGEAYADTLLRDQGVKQGMTLLIGPARSSVTVVGFVSGTSYLGLGSLWSSPATWRSVQNANRPNNIVADGVFQSLLVRGGPTRAKSANRNHPVQVGGANLTRDIDRSTSGRTRSFSVAAAANGIPGVAEQRGVFNQIIAVTVGVALVVVTLFFALLTVERTGLYGVLKAIGARSRTLFFSLVLQAVIVTLLASATGCALAVVLDIVIPSGTIPFVLSPQRVLSSTALLLVAAVLGCAFSLRRVLRTDPASAIGRAQ